MLTKEKKLRKQGRPKREGKYVRLGLNVPVTSKAKLDSLSKALDGTRTDVLVQLIKETNQVYQVKQQNVALHEIGKQTNFVNQYDPNNIHDEDVRSKALDAFYKAEGYNFGTDDDSFILPR